MVFSDTPRVSCKRPLFWLCLSLPFSVQHRQSADFHKEIKIILDFVIQHYFIKCFSFTSVTIRKQYAHCTHVVTYRFGSTKRKANLSINLKPYEMCLCTYEPSQAEHPVTPTPSCALFGRHQQHRSSKEQRVERRSN